MGLHLIQEAVEKKGEFVIHLNRRIDELNSKTAESILRKPEFPATNLVNYLFNLNHIIEVPEEVLDLVCKLHE